MTTEQARKRLLERAKNVNDLVALGLMDKFESDECIARIESILLQGKKETYIENFCRSLAWVWFMTYRPVNIDFNTQILVVVDKNTNEVLWRWSEALGLKSKR